MADFVDWPGYPGKKYTFETHPFGTEFGNYSGVYIACVETTPGRWNALYVGETQSFFDRIYAGLEHHNGLKCARNNGATHLGVMLVYGNAARLAVETELRHVLDPHCNRQSVPTTGNIFAT